MKIAFILDRFPQNGGVENITIKLANEFVKIGYNIMILSLVGDKLEMLSDLNPKVQFCGFENSNFKCNQICNILKREDVNILINQGAYPRTNKIVAKIKKVCPIPVISVLHNEPSYIYKAAKSSMANDSFKAKIKRRLAPLYLLWTEISIRADFRSMARFSESIVLLSDSYISDFIQWVNDNRLNIKDKLCVISNPIGQASDCRCAKKKSILFTGRLDENQKKLSRFIQIWEKLSDRFVDWTFDVVGDGDSRQDYETYVRQHGIERVVFHGFHKDTSKFYAEASILVLTSEYEGLPLVLLEGMINGCVPVIYDTFKSAHNIINSGENGFLITPFNENEFTDKICMLMSTPKRLETMSCYARNIGEKYSFSNIISCWIDLFNVVGHNEK